MKASLVITSMPALLHIAVWQSTTLTCHGLGSQMPRTHEACAGIVPGCQRPAGRFRYSCVSSQPSAFARHRSLS
ncbi:uncharacterized protein C8Q71DRAFT_778592 [Rhodofomes roseus]|uniref:Secreted protein n=1 Tax=Rhodofomes roseus TaxID=34475 RepID=A0ABQ8K5T6_9APHY|nr:uncharacterized protein C8Q71DRAFT_778592 [Rhodofomes roseus]KAH9832335.1 hypothetical protein C8Q71DRAFT_778592 [Rhodofomes roseus]